VLRQAEANATRAAKGKRPKISSQCAAALTDAAARVAVGAAVCSVTPIGAGEVKAGALATTDCTSPIRGTSFFADRYSFSGMAGSAGLNSSHVAIAYDVVRLDATQTGLAAVAPGGVVARIPATTGTFM